MMKALQLVPFVAITSAFLLTACEVQKTQEGKVSLPKYEVQKTQEGNVQLPKYKVETPKVEVRKQERTVTVPAVKKEERTIGIPTGIQVKPADNSR